MAENKTQKTGASVSKFLASIKDETRRKDSAALSSLMKKVTGAKPEMWGPGMVGFGSFHYKSDSGREGDFFLVGFAPRKTALTLYLVGGFPGFDKLLKKLGKHKLSGSCLHIKRLEDVDKGVLEDLIARSFAARKKKYEGLT
jgi:hypothetical protein